MTSNESWDTVGLPPILVVFDYHNDRSKPSLEQPSSEGFLFMTRPQLVQESAVHQDQEYVSGLVELANEAQHFPLVSPLPLAKILASHHFDLEPMYLENPVTSKTKEIPSSQRGSSQLGGPRPPLDIVISTYRLTKVFGRLVAVNDLHLEVNRGDVFGFLGPNGPRDAQRDMSKQAVR